MIGLYRKELRTLFPLFALGAFLVSGDFLTRPFTERLDEATYSSVASIDPGEGGFIAFVQLVLGFVVAYAAFPREHDERTIELLYALPITRARIFLGKALAGLTVLFAVCVLGQITNLLLVWPNPSGFARTQISFDLAARVAFLHAATAAVGYGHGLFASFFRRFGALPYVFLGYAVTVVVELVPAWEAIDPLRLARTEYVGTSLVVPWGAIAAHVAVAGGAAAAGYALWLGDFERLRATLAAQTRAATVGFGCLVALAVVAGLGVSIFLAVREYQGAPPPDPDAVPEPTGIAFRTASARTAHYDFVHPENLRAEALALTTRADAILEAAADTLGAERLPRVTVDLAEESAHHEGIAASTRIRMGLLGQARWRLAHVLAHESTHVLENEESRLRLAEHAATMRFFVEGSAEWVAFEVCTDAERPIGSEDERVEERALRAASRVVAAVAVERHEIRFEDVLDDERFRARFDTTLAYPLGEVLTEAIARGCGRRAVGDLVRAFARDDAPQDAGGEVLLRDALAASRCDLERVVAAWDAVLAETLAAERVRIEAIPRLSGGLVSAADAVVVEATLDRPPLPAERYLLRFRADVRTSDVEIRAVPGEIVEGSAPRRVRFTIPRGGAPPGARFEILFSVEADPRAFPVSETWQSVSIP